MNELKVSGVYRIVNTVTNDFYIGSSRNVMGRWNQHKSPYFWKTHPNIPLYRDFQKYGLDAFRFQILAPVVPEHLKEVEQELIDMLHPTYNDRRAEGLDVERVKGTRKKWSGSDKGKEYQKKYRQTGKYKEHQKKYRQSYKCKEYRKEYMKKYDGQICEYNGETLTLKALLRRFQRAGVEHPAIEAKKYLKNS